MGEESSSRTSAAEISTSESPSKDSQLVDSISNGWTDEKHMLFLDCIEADFVDDLYNEKYHSNLSWLSRIKGHKGSNENDLKCDKFKVLSRGCWKSLKFERDSSDMQIENGSFPLSANPWIQHFQAPSNMREKLLNSSDKCDDIEYFRSSVQLASEILDGEATSSKHICQQDSTGISTEVSDQNFISDEAIVGEKSSRTSRKRRLRAALVHEPINDQVVPSKKALAANSEENPACLRTKNEGSSTTVPEIFPGFLPADT